MPRWVFKKPRIINDRLAKSITCYRVRPFWINDFSDSNSAHNANSRTKPSIWFSRKQHVQNNCDMANLNGCGCGRSLVREKCRKKEGECITSQQMHCKANQIPPLSNNQPKTRSYNNGCRLAYAISPRRISKNSYCTHLANNLSINNYQYARF